MRFPKNFVPPDAPMPGFDGFSKEAIAFLYGLKKNNNKEWFEKHREDYDQYLRNPSKGLVDAMTRFFREHEMPFDANQKTSLFRINRDIRFSKDKSPYKTHVGLWFPMVGMPKDFWCGLYFGFEPASKSEIKAFVGGGVYQPLTPQLKRIRALLDTDYKKYNALTTSKTFQKSFSNGVTGEQLKRMPTGFNEEHPAAEALKMKEFIFRTQITTEEFLDEDLPQILGKHYLAGKDVALFLGKA